MHSQESRVPGERPGVRNATWVRWAGLAAVLGGSLAILLTPPFAIAFFTAYPGYDGPPPWVPSLQPALMPWLTFASPVAVYNVYGRVYELVYPLLLPAVLAVHSLQPGTLRRTEKLGSVLVVLGLAASFVGVAGDYWADGVGFIVEVLGLLILSVGCAIFGATRLRSGVIPTWSGWLLVGCLPGAFIGLALIGHIPSGPTLPIAIAWLLLGSMLLLDRVQRTRPPASGDAQSNAAG